MEWRRDMRHFKADAVSEQQLKILKQAMNFAPSVGNSRPWRVLKIDSSKIRNKIQDIYKVENEKAAEIYQGEQKKHYNTLKLSALEQAPVQLAIFTDIAPVAGHGLGRQSMPETLQYSTITAIHNLWLAARAQNLGVGWVSILAPNLVTSALDVPHNWHFTAYLCIGHPKYADTQPELDREGWQKNIEHDWMVR